MLVLTPSRLAGEDKIRVPPHAFSYLYANASSPCGRGNPGRYLPDVLAQFRVCARYLEVTVQVDFVRGLKCRLCGKQYPKRPLNFCTEDFGPLEVEYDYAGISA